MERASNHGRHIKTIDLNNTFASPSSMPGNNCSVNSTKKAVAKHFYSNLRRRSFQNVPITDTLIYDECWSKRKN